MERKLEVYKPKSAEQLIHEVGAQTATWMGPMAGTLVGPQAKRTFSSGATRDTDQGKLDPEGFLNPEVLLMFSEFMHFNRTMVDGSLRDSDNWQKGMPYEVYMKSLMRHTMSLWRDHRGSADVGPRAGELTAIMFNAMGYLFSLIEEVGPDDVKAEMLAFLAAERMKQKGF